MRTFDYEGLPPRAWPFPESSDLTKARTEGSWLLRDAGPRDADEVVRIQACTADQCTVDVLLPQQLFGIAALHRAAVQDPYARRECLTAFGEPTANGGAHFLSILGRGGPPGADRPHRLVRDDRAGDLLVGKTCQ